MQRAAPLASETHDPLLAGLPAEAVAALSATAVSRQAAGGTILFHQGDPPIQLLQVVSGLAKMTQISAEGTQTTLRVMRPGDLLGCVAVLQQCPYPATATALCDTSVLAWRSDQFLEVMDRYPAVVHNSLRIVGARAREMVERVVAMSGSVEQRVAGALLRLADQAGTRTRCGLELAPPVTREDLAEMAGVTYFTVSRTLSAWQKQGLVTSGRLRIVVLAPARLARIAEGRQGADGGRTRPARE